MPPKKAKKVDHRQLPRKVFKEILSHQMVDGYIKYKIRPVRKRKNVEVEASDFISVADRKLLNAYRQKVSKKKWDMRRKCPISKVVRERNVNGTTMFLCSYQGWDAIWNEEFTKKRLLEYGYGKLLARYKALKAANAVIQQAPDEEMEEEEDEEFFDALEEFEE